MCTICTLASWSIKNGKILNFRCSLPRFPGSPVPRYPMLSVSLPLGHCQKIGMAEKPQTQTGISSVHHNSYLICVNCYISKDLFSTYPLFVAEKRVAEQGPRVRAEQKTNFSKATTSLKSRIRTMTNHYSSNSMGGRTCTCATQYSILGLRLWNLSLAIL